MRGSHNLFWACLTLFLALSAASLYKLHHPPGPIADEAAYLMMTQSLLHDRDLAYTREDLDRVHHQWSNGPNGLILFTDDGGRSMFYGKPFVYSLAALPFYALLGGNGFLVLNALLYGLVGWGVFAWLSRGAPPAVAGLFAFGALLGAASLAYVWWIQPESFNMALVFGALGLWAWRREDAAPRATQAWPWVSGALLGLAAASRVTNGILILPAALDLAWRRDWKRLAQLVAGSALCFGLFLAGQKALTGHWSPYRGVQRRSFSNEYPYQSEKKFWDYGGAEASRAGSWRPRAELRPAVHARNAWYFLAGRHTGLLPYFPFALAAVAWFLVGPRDAAGWFLIAGVAAYAIFFFVFRPFNYHGGAGFVGNRYFACVYPCLLLLVRRVPRPGWLLLPFATAGLFVGQTAFAATMPLAPEPSLQVHTRSRPFQWLPLELTLLGQNRMPGYWRRGLGGALWLLPKDAFFADEPGAAVWMKGSSAAQVIVVSERPLSRIDLQMETYPASNEIEICAGGSAWKRFPLGGSAPGAVRVSVAPRQRARDLGIFFDSGREHYYSLWISCREGGIPARQEPGSADARFLGVRVTPLAAAGD